LTHEGGACDAPYPHHVWLAHWFVVRPPRLLEIVRRRHVVHHLLLTTAGDADIRCETNGSQTAFHATVGTIGWFPSDSHEHEVSITAANGYAAYEVCIPVEQITGDPSPAEGRPAAGPQASVFFGDALIEASLLRLSTRGDGPQVSEDVGDDVAARLIITRLSALLGSSAPQWRTDTSVFSPDLMRRIVTRIDAELPREATVEDLAQAFELSPGHFARKFRYSTGLSLQRFHNLRRIGRSCGMLREGSLSLARIAIDLGFSSQSHFTRVFTGLTGTSPQRFRRLHERMGE
jgi:AraC family transcriptional regulator